MADGEQVVVGLGRFGEAGHPAPLAQLAQQAQPSGDELVRVALVADVEQQPVLLGPEVENVVQGEGEFDDAEVGCEVPAGLGDLVADGVPDVLRQGLELFDGELLEVGRSVDGLEQVVGHRV